jgi:pyridoxal phosphate enzyme, yggS family
MSIVDSLASVKATLPGGVKLIAVSKTHSTERILEAYNAGQRAFGENKVQELVPKYEALPKDIEWHLIGHLQRNKVKLVVPFVSLIHSVDSEKLLSAIDQEAEKAEREVKCLIQVHIAEEETKFGFTPDEAFRFFVDKRPAAYKHVRIAGLMGMATLTDDTTRIRKEFSLLHNLFEKVRAEGNVTKEDFSTLSMGMSSDYPIAVESGSTMVRVGSAIFGKRDYGA